MEEIKKYHLHKDNYAQLHFELKEMHPYLVKNRAHSFKAHRHSFYQLILFEKAGSHFIDYETIEHPANSLFFINKNQVHYFCPFSPNEGKLFHFNDFFLHQFEKDNEQQLTYKIYDEIGAPFITAPVAEIEKIKLLASLIEKEIAERPFNYRQQVYHYLQSILLQVERLKRLQNPQQDIQDHEYQLVRSFKKQLEQHLSDPFTVDEYSSQLGVSKKTLTNILKKHLGDTPANLIQKRKVLEAKRLLANTNISIKEVAYQLGFDQPTYFTKFFKKHTQLTPKAFIQQLP